MFAISLLVANIMSVAFFSQKHNPIENFDGCSSAQSHDINHVTLA